MPRTAVIGGTGFYSIASAALKEKKAVDTKYGQVIVSVYEAEGGEEFAFIPRHGEGHACAPHKVNYRANIIALKQMGVERVIGVCSVGSLRKNIKPGDFVLVDQFLDFTKSRPSTFFDEDGCVVHTNVTEPYCPEMRAGIGRIPSGRNIHKKGTYVCADGPRFETAAEIKMFAALGGDVVGMTGVPECVLARELGMCYACIAVVTNYAAGLDNQPVSHEEVMEEMEKLGAALQDYVISCLAAMPEKPGCHCKDAPGKI
jgi:5'-methylthioadenosine phosphorylase